jgi:hypothetical protein
MSIFLLVSGLTLFSCRKDDGTPPLIDLDAPYSGMILEVPDSFEARGIVQDPEGIEYIQLQVLKPSGAPIAGVVQIDGKGRNSIEFDEWFFLTDASLASGSYSFKVTAVDVKGAKAVQYRSLNLSEWPLDRLGVLFVYEHSATEMRSAFVDNSGTLTTLSKRSMDFSDATINHRSGQLLMAGSVTGPTLGINIVTDQPDFTINSSNSQSTPYFTSVYSFENRAWLNFYDGRVREIRPDGSTKGEFTVLLDHHAEEVLLSGNELFLELRNHTPGPNRLRMVNVNTGGGAQDHLFQGDIVQLMPRNGQTIYALINEQGQADMYIYDIASNEKSTIRDLAIGTASDASPVDANRILVAQEDGIYLFDYSTTNYVRLNDLTDPKFVAFDPVYQQYAVAGTNFLRIYEFPSGTQSYNLNLKYEVTALEMWYSR